MYGLGVDLGTSFSAAAVTANGALDMIALSGASLVTPSAAYLDEGGDLLTGEAADRIGMRDPARAAWEFKRRLGDPTPVMLAGLPFSPAALMAAQLRSILDKVTEAQGGPPDHVVLTHPAVWGAYRQEQFAAIPRLAGLPVPEKDGQAPASGPVVLTTTEPVAAATYYSTTRPLPPNGLLAVYDLGGGTFDSAVVRNGRSGLEIVGTPEGIEWLGGADFDRAVLAHADHVLDGAISALDPADPRTAVALAAMHRECIVAKEALSTRAQAQMSIALPDGRRTVVLTRDTFEQMITPSLDTTIEVFRRTLANTGITQQDLTAVLLVGGSSEIPRVTELLRDTIRRPILINTHPKHAVSLGAAKLSADALALLDKRTGRRTTRSTSETTAPPVPPAPQLGPATEEASPLPESTLDLGRPEQAPASGPPAAIWRRWRKPKLFPLAAAVAVAALVTAIFLLGPQLATGSKPCGTANVAFAQPASASASEGSAYAPANAVDGKPDTRWGSAFDDPQWLQVDLGQEMQVCGVTIEWETAYAKAFRIELSADGATWRDAYHTTRGGGGTRQLEVTGSGRYLRLYCVTRSASFGYSVWELKVFTNRSTASAHSP